MVAYGIDLGTTYSCIAYVDDAGRPIVLKSAVGEDTTPSVVYFESPDSVVVGKEAKDSALLVPDLVVERIKREMGQNVRYTFHGQEHTPESVSALILRELARAAQEQTGEVVQDVVITVPAYFGALEREATRKAGQIAGLNVLDVLDEPTAAILAYQALGESSGVRHILIYDLGGGTFDTTVIRIDGHDVQVVCTDGSHHLGGADWDSKITDFLMHGFTDQHPQLDPGGDEQFMQDLATSAEQLKRALSATRTRRYNVRFDGCVVRLELTREQLEEITSELLERTMEITERTIATAQEKGVDYFDDVLLVGGMTRMPVIAATLSERFNLEPKSHEPELAVAKGPALFASIQKVMVGLPGLSVEEVVATAIASSALLPFIQALAARAADDVYSSLRRLRFPVRPLSKTSLTQTETVVKLADEAAKIVLELPPVLNSGDQESLRRLLERLVHHVPDPEAGWLHVSPSRGDGWSVQLIDEIPHDSVILESSPFVATSNRGDGPPDVLEAVNTQKRERIVELERERKLLRGMVRYLANEIDP